MKKFLLALLALMMLTVSVEAAEPVRIARLPIIFHSSTPDRDTCAVLETKIARAVSLPRNKTLHVAEYIPTKISTEALRDIWQRLRAKTNRPKPAEAIRLLAREVDADIVICPVLLQYSQRVMNDANGATIMDSTVQAALVVYDRRTDTLVDKRAAQSYHDNYHPLGTASALAKICFDNLIDATDLRRRIRAIR